MSSKRKIKPVIGKTYLNPWTEKKFEVLDIGIAPSTSFIKETDQKVKIQYSDEEPKWITFEIIQPMIEQTVTQREVAGVDCGCNLATDDFPMFLDDLKRSGANIGSKAHQIMNKIHSDYRKEIPDEWLKSTHEWIYRESPKSKGHLTKKFCLALFDAGTEFEVANNTANNHENGIEIYQKGPGHDGVVDGRKKACRMSCKFNKTFTFFQVRQEQDFDDLVFLFVHPEHIEIYQIEKSTFIAYLKDHEDEVVWAGGKEKRQAIEGKIEKNDLFHWNVKMPRNLEQYGFDRIL